MINYDAVNSFIGREWEYMTNDCFAVFKKASKLIFGRDIKSIDLPGTSSIKESIKIFENELSGQYWNRVFSPAPGDAVFFFDKNDHPFHIGLYIENGNVLHCPGSNKNPQKTTYENLRLINRFVYRRFEYYRPC